MTTLALAIYAINLAAFVLLVRNGKQEDWWAAGLFILSLIASPFLEPLTFGTWRAGSCVLNSITLVVLWAIAFRGDRWWLILATIIQTVTTATHLIPLFDHGLLVWSGVLLRNVLYILLSGVFFMGAWEAWADQRFRQEANHGTEP